MLGVDTAFRVLLCPLYDGLLVPVRMINIDRIKYAPSPTYREEVG